MGSRPGVAIPGRQHPENAVRHATRIVYVASYTSRARVGSHDFTRDVLRFPNRSGVARRAGPRIADRG